MPLDLHAIWPHQVTAAASCWLRAAGPCKAAVGGWAAATGQRQGARSRVTAPSSPQPTCCVKLPGALISWGKAWASGETRGGGGAARHLRSHAALPPDRPISCQLRLSVTPSTHHEVPGPPAPRPCGLRQASGLPLMYSGPRRAPGSVGCLRGRWGGPQTAVSPPRVPGFGLFSDAAAISSLPVLGCHLLPTPSAPVTSPWGSGAGKMRWVCGGSPWLPHAPTTVPCHPCPTTIPLFSGLSSILALWGRCGEAGKAHGSEASNNPRATGGCPATSREHLPARPGPPIPLPSRPPAWHPWPCPSPAPPRSPVLQRHRRPAD